MQQKRRVENMKKTEIKNLKKGEFFKRDVKGQPSAKVYIKGDYDRATKSYSAIEYEDIQDLQQHGCRRRKKCDTDIHRITAQQEVVLQDMS